MSQCYDEKSQSIEDNGTWELYDSLKDTPVPTHVVLIFKRDTPGHIDRFKARIFAELITRSITSTTWKQMLQWFNSHYSELFCMVICLGMIIAQIEVNTAFLNGLLEKDVWIMSPRGIPGIPSRLYKLNKSLYGLKQSHWPCHKKLCAFVLNMGVSELYSAPYVFK